MARNVDIALDLYTLDRVNGLDNALDLVSVGSPLTIDFLKRDGTPRTLEGTFDSMAGRQGTSSRVVTVLTDKGMRSANLFNIVSVNGDATGL